jgi:hypothetical protein
MAGLYPSIYLNVKPWWMHDRGMALVQLVLTLIAAAIPLIIFRLHWVERIFFVAILLGVLRVSVANGIESITLTRSEIASGREDHLSVNKEWTARIETWTGERDKLRATFVPIGDKKEYIPTSRELVETEREGRDSACKTSRTSNDCKYAQTKLEQVTQNYELTLRIDALERDIRDAQAKISEAGSAPPDYLGKARDALEGAWFNPLKDREMWTAYMAELAAAGAPKLFVCIVSLLFAAALGENWWLESTHKIESTKVDTPVIESTGASVTKEKRVQKPTTSTGKVWGAQWLDGVKAWVDTVRPVPGGARQRYTPSQAFPHYVEFCEARGYTPCGRPTVFGSIITKHIDVAPVVRTGGQSWYEFNLGPKLALVKAGGEA